MYIEVTSISSPLIMVDVQNNSQDEDKQSNKHSTENENDGQHWPTKHRGMKQGGQQR